MRSSYNEYYLKEFGEPDYDYCWGLLRKLEEMEEEIKEEQKD